MTERVLHVHIEDEDTFFARAKKAFQQASADSGMEASEHLTFATHDQWHSVFSARRTELLKTLKTMGSTSIRNLAKTVGRDYKSVHQDVQRLCELGVIEKRDDGLIEAPFDRIVSDMRFPSSDAA